MSSSSRGVWLPVLLALVWANSGGADISVWKLGGNGEAWDRSDSLRVMIDFETAPGAIQPIYIRPDRSIFSYLDNWAPRKTPDELGFVDGERPRAWKGGEGSSRSDANGINMIDGDGATYNPVTSNSISGEYYTIDTAVPVPAFRFAMRTPTTGFRTDGLPLSEDAVPAYEVSISAEGDWQVNSSGLIGEIIAEARENVVTHVVAGFPAQYVRYVRYTRKTSILDEFADTYTGSHQGKARQGTIADFELFGEGVPKRAVLVTRIFDLGQEVNFGRILWSATPLRRVGGELVETPDAAVSIQIETRTGLDDDPNLYHEFTDSGSQVVVSRERYETVLKNRSKQGSEWQRPKPGLRGEILYDSDSWTYWSVPIRAPEQSLGLDSGSHLQLKITLHSESFADLVRLDSLWIEKAPLLARRVAGEVSLLEEPQPIRGVAEVEIGTLTDFAYDVAVEFGPGEPGFDALRIHTGSQAEFRGLEMGEETIPVEQVETRAEEGALIVYLPERVAPGNEVPLRVFFATQVFDFARTFAGEVFDRDGLTLPQPIRAGDANEAVSTNGLRVLAAPEQNPDLAQELTLSTSILTPNGDSINDELEISYVLFGLPQEIPVRLQVFSLDGRQVVSFDAGLQRSGPQQLRWNGRGIDGESLLPGIYLLGVSFEAEENTVQQLLPIGIVY